MTAILVAKRPLHWHGTSVPPADLDGALQWSSVLAQQGLGGGKTRLPFAIEEARVRGVAVGALWAVSTYRAGCLVLLTCTM